MRFCKLVKALIHVGISKAIRRRVVSKKMESYTESFFALVFTERVTAFKQKLVFSVILITFSSSDWDWASCREPIGAAEVSKPMGTVI